VETTEADSPGELASAAPAQPIESSRSHAWRVLRHRNFQLFVFGQSISLIGTWMTRVATGWLVYCLTGSALLLGTVSFCGRFRRFCCSWIQRARDFDAVWQLCFQ
jgi:hypothetical protein